MTYVHVADFQGIKPKWFISPFYPKKSKELHCLKEGIAITEDLQATSQFKPLTARHCIPNIYYKILFVLCQWNITISYENLWELHHHVPTNFYLNE